jgi:hypothetical protein
MRSGWHCRFSGVPFLVQSKWGFVVVVSSFKSVFSQTNACLRWTIVVGRNCTCSLIYNGFDQTLLALIYRIWRSWLLSIYFHWTSRRCFRFRIKLRQYYGRGTRNIMHAKTSCLHSSGNYWGKRTSSSLFDVTKGSFDGAESCELVGSYLPHLITTKHGNNFGLYRDKH